MLGKIIKSLRQLTSKTSPLLAIHLGRSSLSLLEVKQGEITPGAVVDYRDENWQPALTQLLADAQTGTRLHIVLAAEFYQIVQLDKPALAETEILQALPWQVKDLVTVAPDDMITDYIDLPGFGAQQAKINVVVVRQSWLKQLTQFIQHKGLQIVSIQPEEWLALHLLPASSHATMLVIQQPEQDVLIQIVRDGMLYFSRRTRGFSRLQVTTLGESQTDALDRLQLELQRSMDYFESQLKQAPVRNIRLLMPNAEPICTLLMQNGFSRVEVLPPLGKGAGLTAAQWLIYWPALAVLQPGLPESAA